MKRLLVLLILLLASLPLAAQTFTPKNELFGFFDDPRVWSTEAEGTHLNTGYGLSLRHFATPHVSAELSVARHYHFVTVFYPPENGVAVPPERFRSRDLPIDALVSYHFAPQSRWQPFAGIGLHYLATSGAPEVESQTRLEVAGGLAFSVTQRFFVRADVKHLLGNSALFYDPATRAGVGFGWRF